jgi:hypothetical protein
MSISAEDIAGIAGVLAELGASRPAIAAVRQRYPGVSVTVCDRSDIDAEIPYRELQTCSLFLVDGTDHCWRLTGDPARATGVVVASHGAVP